MNKVEDLHGKWMKGPRYKKAHEELATEFELARAVIQARANAVTQEELAKRMKTTQSVIARLESGRNDAIHRYVVVPGSGNRNPSQDYL